MVTKTFKAESALQTLQLVQAEFGANAIVVSMREVPNGPAWNPWKNTAVEIVASMPEHPMVQAQAPILKPAGNSNGVEFIEERPEIEWESEPDRQFADLRAQSHTKLKLNFGSEIREHSPAPVEAPLPKARPEVASNDKYVPPVLKKIQQQLIVQGVENNLVESLINLSLETLSPATLGNETKCTDAIIQLLGAELPVQRSPGNYFAGNVICLIGASGSGKTSSMAKLALFYSEKVNKNITWVCADTVRSGAVAEARAYADALGFKLKLVYGPEDLVDLREVGTDELFLVDTPGYNPYSENQMVELGSLLTELPRRCTYLVASATMKESDLYQLSASLGIFDLTGVIITKLDETHSFGSVYNFARRNRLPLSFFAKGRDAALDLEIADPARLASALFGREWIK